VFAHPIDENFYFKGRLHMLYAIFAICLGIGIGFAIIIFLLFKDTNTHFWDISLGRIRLSFIATFLIVFGFTGFLGKTHTGNFLAVGIALVCGIAAITILWQSRFCLKYFRKPNVCERETAVI